MLLPSQHTQSELHQQQPPLCPPPPTPTPPPRKEHGFDWPRVGVGVLLPCRASLGSLPSVYPPPVVVRRVKVRAARWKGPATTRSSQRTPQDYGPMWQDPHSSRCRATRQWLLRFVSAHHAAVKITMHATKPVLDESVCSGEPAGSPSYWYVLSVTSREFVILTVVCWMLHLSAAV
jgi:hypothetical protein